MWRLIIVVIIVGGALAFYGFNEYRLSSGASAEPVSVSLEDLEAGKAMPDRHLSIGKHNRIYELCVYNYEAQEGQNKPKPDSTINHLYVPIVSDKNPYLAKYKATKVGQKLPKMDGVAVIIKTSRFDKYRDIPDGMRSSTGTTGLVVNRVEDLGSEEKALLRSSFKSIDWDKVLILEEDRKPTNKMLAMGMMAGGGLLIIAPLGLFLALRGKSKARAAQAQAQANAQPFSQPGPAGGTAPSQPFGAPPSPQPQQPTPPAPPLPDDENNPYRQG